MEGGSCNDYDYVCGDPVNGLDLSGLWSNHPIKVSCEVTTRALCGLLSAATHAGGTEISGATRTYLPTATICYVGCLGNPNWVEKRTVRDAYVLQNGASVVVTQNPGVLLVPPAGRDGSPYGRRPDRGLTHLRFDPQRV